MSKLYSKKMKVIHYANLDFEWELESRKGTHPRFQAYETLPERYAPGEPYLRYLEFDRDVSSFNTLESWGASENLKTWAASKGLHYNIPSLDIVRWAASKVTSLPFNEIEGTCLLNTREEVDQWWSQGKVLKTPFGFTGRGHIFSKSYKRLPLIGQPWVERVIDFATHWMIHPSKDVEYLGTTEMQNTSRGSFLKAFRNESLFEPSHKDVVTFYAKGGYFGHLSVDAMWYLSKGLKKHTVVEVNPRKTMGWVALIEGTC